MTSTARSQKATLHSSSCISLSQDTGSWTQAPFCENVQGSKRGHVGVWAESPHAVKLASRITCQTNEGSTRELPSLSHHLTAAPCIPRIITSRIMKHNNNQELLLSYFMLLVVACHASINNCITANQASVHKIKCIRSSRETKIQKA